MPHAFASDANHLTRRWSERRTAPCVTATAIELAYDNYNFFVIGFGPSERASDCVVTIAASLNGVGLCFVHGASLPDPGKVLLGSGKQTRFVRLPSADVIDEPAVQKLLSVAVERSRTAIPSSGRGKLIIRSVSAKQRPRRKPGRAQGHPE